MSITLKNYYHILGVSETANNSQIKKAYRQLALKYHPDSNSGYASEAKFIEITEAYSILNDGHKKKYYDQMLKDYLYSYPSNSKNINQNKQEQPIDNKEVDIDEFRIFVRDARRLAYEYTQMSYNTFSRAIKSTIYHTNKIFDLFGELCITIMVIFGSLFYFAYLYRFIFIDKQIIYALLLTLLSPVVLLFVYGIISGFYNSIKDYFRSGV